MNGQYEFGLVSASDTDEVIRLYRGIVGTPGCTWSTDYPAVENVLSDIVAGSLYCLRDADRRIVAAAAAGGEEELGQDGIGWDARMKRSCELARIGVTPALQGRGLGGLMLRELMRDAGARGYDGIRLIMSRTNPAALALYEKLGFSRCGELHKYGIDFFVTRYY